MPTRWKVTHQVNEPIVVATTVAGFPSLDIVFRFDAAGALVRIEHELDLDDRANDATARIESAARVRAVVDALRFTRGGPIHIARSDAEALSPLSPTSSPGTRTVTATADAVIVCAARFPTEVAISQASQPGQRVGAWLELANRAVCAPDDEHAIRDYFLILEEHATGKTLSPQVQQLKWIRHFCSHPEIDKDKRAVAFINSELGVGGITCPKYDARDPKQRAMLDKWRKIAHAHVDGLLNALLY